MRSSRPSDGPEGSRDGGSFDLLIAAVARANRLAVATRNPVDFAGLDDLVEVHAV